MKQIRLIFYLPNLKDYLDRVFLVNQIASKTEVTYLITSKIDIVLHEHKLDNLKVIQISKKISFFGSTMISASKFVAKLIKDEKINIVHDTFGHLLPLMILKKSFSGVFFISSFYNIAVWDFFKILRKKYSWLKIITDKNLFYYLHRILNQKLRVNYADAIFLQALPLLDRLLKFYSVSKNKFHVVPNNVEKQLYKIDEIVHNDNQVITLLFAGKISSGKGGDFMINLLKVAREMNVSLTLDIIGGIATFDRKYYLQQIKKFGLQDQIRFLDRIDSQELRKHYQKYDWLIHFTCLDGSPRVVPEALMAGLPVIASRHPGVKVFDKNEDFILFVDKTDVEKLVTVLKLEKENNVLYRKRACLGQEVIKNKFSSQIIKDQYVTVYKNLIQQL